MKIGVYTCMKNEALNVGDWLEQTQHADHVVILDTGSTDDTMSILRGIYCRDLPHLNVVQATVDPWRFDVALNVALSLLPPDVDVAVQLSADERLSGGWRAPLEASVGSHDVAGKAFANAVPRCTKFHYEYFFTPDFKFWHDRIHSRRGYTWRYPFHEGCYPENGAKETHVTVPGLTVRQNQNRGVDRMLRDLVLAEQALAEWPHDARMVFYAGRQFMYAGQYRKALDLLQRYTVLTKERGWDHPMEAAWVADAVAQCWRAVEAGGK